MNGRNKNMSKGSIYCHYFRQGFTLIELLVVVAIISLLVSILLPSLHTAKELARQVQCMSNLRSIGTGYSLYMNDYNGYYYPGYYLPAGGIDSVQNMWTYHLMPYCGAEEWSNSNYWYQHLPGIYFCPSHEAAVKNFNTGSGEGWAGSFVMNAFVSNFNHPIEHYNTAAQYFMLEYYTVGHAAPTEMLLNYLRHNDEGDYLFMDGHVEGQSDLGPLPVSGDPMWGYFEEYKTGWKPLLVSQ